MLLLLLFTSFGVDVQNDERYNVKLFPPFSERRNIMKLLIALIVTLIMLTVFKNVETLAASLSYPYDNSGFEDRPPQGVFNTIMTAHNQELVMSRLRVYEIVPVKPSTVFTTDVPEIFVVFQLHQHGAEFRVYGRWFIEGQDGVSPNLLLGEDGMIITTEDQSGYVSMKRPTTGWPIGQYKVRMYIGTGEADRNPIGTLYFTVVPDKNTEASAGGTAK